MNFPILRACQLHKKISPPTTSFDLASLPPSPIHLHYCCHSHAYSVNMGIILFSSSSNSRFISSFSRVFEPNFTLTASEYLRVWRPTIIPDYIDGRVVTSISSQSLNHPNNHSFLVLYLFSFRSAEDATSHMASQVDGHDVTMIDIGGHYILTSSASAPLKKASSSNCAAEAALPNHLHP